jgi:hypothetical protein
MPFGLRNAGTTY